MLVAESSPIVFLTDIWQDDNAIAQAKKSSVIFMMGLF
ncbi:hypothetical protein MuYL_3807 [Mucilaginibacter xinganensis]|uniref:Uncharacterized protein n=1 Tax=Mucilaginibacter xinganensis TaxID=1234841 RepID=A0A223P0Q7_9SPHI|nr:hypothetical protein MuYL_3807 [Mucilaginibacter xinganensis]